MNRWKYAFVALVALLFGGGGLVVMVMALPYTMKYKAVYIVASLVGLVALGFSIALLVSRAGKDDEEGSNLEAPEKTTP